MTSKTVTYQQTGIRSSSGQHHSGLHDGNLSTPWSDNRQGAWIIYDLGSVNQVNNVIIAFGEGASITYQFSVETSLDGVTFEPVIKRRNSKKSNDLEDYSFKAENTQFVKLVVHENDNPIAPNKASVTELVVTYEPGAKASKDKDTDKKKSKSTKTKKSTEKKTKPVKQKASGSKSSDEDEDVDEGPIEKHAISITQDDFDRVHAPDIPLEPEDIVIEDTTERKF